MFGAPVVMTRLAKEKRVDRVAMWKSKRIAKIANEANLRRRSLMVEECERQEEED